MTGIGKTGLAVALLEEAAIDGIPAIVVDPKGDLSNLLLTFPSLAEADFAPWVSDGRSATQEATAWREVLRAWDQDGERIGRLQTSREVRGFTPGSDAGIPLSMLKAHIAAGSAQAGTTRRLSLAMVSSQCISSRSATSFSRELQASTFASKNTMHSLLFTTSTMFFW